MGGEREGRGQQVHSKSSFSTQFVGGATGGELEQILVVSQMEEEIRELKIRLVGRVEER